MQTPRSVPETLARRNRGYLILLLLLPITIGLNVAFWWNYLPGVYHTADRTRHRQLAHQQALIEQALADCRRDTGGAPVRLEILRQFGVAPGDLTPGGDRHKWRGPYLPAGQPFPGNPFRPHDGAAGWRYLVRGDTATITPAHSIP